MTVIPRFRLSLRYRRQDPHHYPGGGKYPPEGPCPLPDFPPMRGCKFL